MKKQRIILSTAAGHIIEYFDSYLYGYFAFMLAPTFFPSDNPTTAMIASYGAFAAGFIMRPLGGILFGHLGDRLGRKRAFIYSVAAITIPTFGIGILPSYDSIGILAPVMLITFRLLQGISLGGEYGGAAIFIREHVGKNAPGYAGSLLATMGFIGALCGTGIAAIFTMEHMPPWAWRVPFLLGGCFGVAVFFLRQRLVETPTFKEIEEQGEILQTPIISVFQNHFPKVLSGVGIGMNTTIPYYLAIIYMNSHYQNKFELSTSAIMTISTSLMVLWVMLLPLAGWLSDTIGRTKLMAYSALTTATVAIPCLYGMQTTNDFSIFLSLQLVICLTSIPYVATCSSVLPTLFPPQERYSGSAFSYSLGVAVFGGTAPMIVTWLVSLGISHAAGIYLSFASLCGWYAVSKINEEKPQSLTKVKPQAIKDLAA